MPLSCLQKIKAWHISRQAMQRAWTEWSYLVLDIETSGLDPKQDHIVSVGWVCIHKGVIELDTARHIVLDSAPIGDSVGIHMITDSDVQQQGKTPRKCAALPKASPARARFGYAPRPYGTGLFKARMAKRSLTDVFSELARHFSHRKGQGTSIPATDTRRRLSPWRLPRTLRLTRIPRTRRLNRRLSHRRTTTRTNRLPRQRLPTA